MTQEVPLRGGHNRAETTGSKDRAGLRSAAQHPADRYETRWSPTGGYRISNARKSLTLVNVGPGTTRSPSGWKKL